jgi:hypothetical protein
MAHRSPSVTLGARCVSGETCADACVEADEGRCGRTSEVLGVACWRCSCGDGQRSLEKTQRMTHEASALQERRHCVGSRHKLGALLRCCARLARGLFCETEHESLYPQLRFCLLAGRRRCARGQSLLGIDEQHGASRHALVAPLGAHVLLCLRLLCLVRLLGTQRLLQQPSLPASARQQRQHMLPQRRQLVPRLQQLEQRLARENVDVCVEQIGAELDARRVCQQGAPQRERVDLSGVGEQEERVRGGRCRGGGGREVQPLARREGGGGVRRKELVWRCLQALVL